MVGFVFKTCMYLLHKLAQFYNDLLIADSLRFPPSQAMKLTCIASHVCLHLFVRSVYCAMANLMTLCQTIRAFCCCHSVPVCWNGFFGHIYWSCQSRQLMKKLAFTGTVWMALLSKLLQVKFKCDICCRIFGWLNMERCTCSCVSQVLASWSRFD